MNRSNKTILYVDDEIQNLQGFKVAFYDEFAITTAQSAEEALEILQTTECKVVISDQRMAGMSGLDLLSIINQKYPDIVCIILTAFIDTNAVLKALNQGGIYRFMLKPWNEIELRLAIDQALERFHYKTENTRLLANLVQKNYELEQSYEQLKQTTEIIQQDEIVLKEQNEEYVAINEELKQTVAELELAKERAEASDRLKRSFLQNISHEIRTPMNAIVGFASLLNEDDVTGEQIKDYTNIIYKCSSQLLSIVTNVLTVSAIDTGKDKVEFTEIQVQPLLMELGNIFEKEALKKGLNFSLDISDIGESVFFRTDETKFNQIITNLLNNAIKYTPSGSVTMGGQITNGMLRIYVKDSGIGISPEHHDFVFHRFNRVDSEYAITQSGTGLGLSITKSYVELLNGNIWIESALNEGSTFWVSFPYKSISRTALQKTDTQNSINKIKGKTILVAEDEIQNYTYLFSILNSAGALVIHAKNGFEAVTEIKKNSHIDLILMDIRMPILNGIEATRMIKTYNKDIPVLAQTAYSNFKEDKESTNLFDSFLIKPIDKLLLLETISTYL